jgi:hypothetical protein
MPVIVGEQGMWCVAAMPGAYRCFQLSGDSDTVGAKVACIRCFRGGLSGAVGPNSKKPDISRPGSKIIQKGGVTAITMRLHLLIVFINQ